MPKFKKLSGKEVVSIFKKFGFEVFNQKGSHVKLRRIKNASKEILIIPNHKELDTGTTRAILRQATKYIATGALSKEFYN